MTAKGERRKVKGKTLRTRLFYMANLLLLFNFLLFPFAFSLVGCGKKGNPRAPELAMPETIRDLRGQTAPEGIALTWSRPLRYVDGSELRDLAGFVIYRKEISAACPDCPVPYRERATVSVEDQQKFMKTRRFRFVDQELTPQLTYRYRVFSQLLDGSLSEPSNEVEVAWRR
ncbi:MAG: hypothetical protein HYV04_08880 [Deltaproteobacteria bacterium]|nr:hypothetical protein [Deltaproteobacteria bacterium]